MVSDNKNLPFEVDISISVVDSVDSVEIDVCAFAEVAVIDFLVLVLFIVVAWDVSVFIKSIKLVAKDSPTAKCVKWVSWVMLPFTV